VNDTPQPRPPAGLSARSRSLWEKYAPAGESAGRLALLEEALRALDQADCARAIVDRDGLILSGGKIPHLHPAVRVEHQARAQFVKMWDHLGLLHHSGGEVVL